VREDVHEEFPGGFQSGGDFVQKELVVFHVLEEFNGDDAVIGVRREGVVDDVAGYDLQVLEAFGLSDAVDVLFLGTRVGERGYKGVGEDFGEVEGC
jgi:hypothetical protein